MNFYSSFTKPRKPLAPFSAKRLSEHERREQVRKEVLERDRVCRLSLHVRTGICGGPLDVHEPKTRARGGNYLDPDECVLLCRKHHDWVHDHPTEATELGLLIASWDQVPPAGAGVSALVPDNQNLPGGCPVSAGES